MTQSHKEARFQAIVMPHLNAAFNLARWLTRNGPDAEDIVQEAYLRAFTFFDSFVGEDGRAWLLTIVRNTFYTWHQQNKTQNTTFDEQYHIDEDENFTALQEHDTRRDNNPESILLQKDSQRQLLHALKALPLAFREVMVLRELEELSYKQIATIIGIPVGTVMSRLGRGRELLQKKIQGLPVDQVSKDEGRDKGPTGLIAPITPNKSNALTPSTAITATPMQREI
ncbi:sigma-70 family RNA polymerase sigma factor [Glaciimonas immobilis]|uniref:RNA polymerase sigma factor n=1 Tax=Glaciimonas immobilis TaxID=728004 RepID=A0A840RLP5_9BURK|nr:sigma-70 family RNA polymerase sigma factor [Glaciimonas immobilis]KAF3998096.1 sigma-70 family RNA polymerase sigma factor [Glaciimonas immobilis]MBB5199207.1 RNA polymerase sigma-70 factor (ECF subfamily) [Glaciimonas immobilis]